MKAALYIRVSTSEQALHGYSLPAQEALLRQYAAEHDMQVYGVYADEGISASKALTKRKALLSMLDDAENGKFSVILFKDITRWSRSSKQYWTIQDRLDKCKVGWISVQQPYLGTTNPTNRFQTGIMLGTAQLESEQTGERIKFVQSALLRDGFYPFGDACLPRGYTTIKEGSNRQKLVPDPEQADLIRDIFEYYSTCGSQRATERKFGLVDRTVRVILRNRVYIGEFKGIPGFCEPIVSEDLFNRVQVLLDGNAHPPKNRGLYTFSSLGRCECGYCISGNVSGNHVYYRCLKCKKVHISEERLEKAFFDKVDEYIENVEIEVKPKKKPSREAEKRKKLLDKMNRLNELYIDGNVTKADYQTRKTALEAQISALDVKPKKIPKGFKGDWKTAYRALDPQKRNVLWRTVCKGFTLSHDKTVTIFFR